MITLADAKKGMTEKVDQQVVDTFRRESPLLDALVFDDAVTPTGGGSTLTYGYLRTKTPAVAGFREIGKEYTPQEAKKEKHTVELKVFGGSYEIDRVIATTSGQSDEVAYQTEEKVKAARNLFHYTIINGDSTTDTKTFDGLDKALVGTSTEINKESHIDLSTSDAMDSNYKLFLDMLDAFLSELHGRPSFLMGNNKMITKLQGIARRAGYLTQTEDAFGKKVPSYNGIPLLDLGFYTKVGESSIEEVPAVAIQQRSFGSGDSATTVTGLTDLYAPVIGLSDFHGVTVTGNNIINTYLPDFKQPGAVKKGEVEMIAAIALKNTRGAGVLRNIKVK